jgi:hypothetical protein
VHVGRPIVAATRTPPRSGTENSGAATGAATCRNAVSAIHSGSVTHHADRGGAHRTETLDIVVTRVSSSN